MEEIVKVVKNENGVDIVSLKNLHESLGVRKDFSSWAKSMFKYGFEEGLDFTPIRVKSSGGRDGVDYAIIIDMAKEISMLQRTERGKIVRLYFIELEKANKVVFEQPKPLSQIELILQSAQVLADQEKQIGLLKESVSNIEKYIEDNKKEKAEATKLLLSVERSTDKVPDLTKRANIRQIVNQYCGAKGLDQQSVWRSIYEKLYYRYGVNLNACMKKKRESNLELAERLGHIDKIYAIVSETLV